MRTRSSGSFATLLLASLLTAFASAGHAQVFDLEKGRVQLASLEGLWRFHPGDDADGKLGWANPAFDDSQWALLRSDRSWSAQGYGNSGGFGWYRFQVVLPETYGAAQQR
jgi:sigma-B regulation protein RsbU (phosphoserine phosphatase)